MRVFLQRVRRASDTIKDKAQTAEGATEPEQTAAAEYSDDNETDAH